MNSAAPIKIGCNDACPCGSENNYKACCAVIKAPFKARQAPKPEVFLARVRQAAKLGDFDSAEFYFREVLMRFPCTPKRWPRSGGLLLAAAAQGR